MVSYTPIPTLAVCPPQTLSRPCHGSSALLWASSRSHPPPPALRPFLLCPAVVY
ncbi:hypothetical protein BD779DRAFT_1550158 [Infundibulicybe gibba]|nr:hypothetical protein BD779DRAFT_1550158 [Infundibulicybe gibba]